MHLHLKKVRVFMGSRAKAASTASFMILPFQYSQIRQKGIGLVVPFDFALDDECWRWLPAGASLYIMRTLRPGETAVTAKLAKEVSSSEAVVPAVRSLLSAQPSSVAYGCTSGSFIGGIAGEALLCEAMQQAGAEIAVTTSGAMVMALKELGVRCISIATPYNEELTRLLVDFLKIV